MRHGHGGVDVPDRRGRDRAVGAQHHPALRALLEDLPGHRGHLCPRCGIDLLLAVEAAQDGAFEELIAVLQGEWRRSVQAVGRVDDHAGIVRVTGQVVEGAFPVADVQDGQFRILVALAHYLQVVGPDESLEEAAGDCSNCCTGRQEGRTHGRHKDKGSQFHPKSQRQLAGRKGVQTVIPDDLLRLFHLVRAEDEDAPPLDDEGVHVGDSHPRLAEACHHVGGAAGPVVQFDGKDIGDGRGHARLLEFQAGAFGFVADDAVDTIVRRIGDGAGDDLDIGPLYQFQHLLQGAGLVLDKNRNLLDSHIASKTIGVIKTVCAGPVPGRPSSRR